VGFVVMASAVASAVAWGAVALISRIARHPRRAWITAGLLAMVVSLSVPLTGNGITATGRSALVCMHLAVAAVLIPAFALAIPRRRPAEDAPELRDDAMLRASSASLSRAGSGLTGPLGGQNPDEAAAASQAGTGAGQNPAGSATRV
jgi:hypothetical protein